MYLMSKDISLECIPNMNWNRYEVTQCLRDLEVQICGPVCCFMRPYGPLYDTFPP